MTLIRFLRKTLELDYRSLAFYRFFIGIIIMLDVVARWPFLQTFYTDVGIIPRSIFINELAMEWSFSLHLANGSLAFIQIMFVIHFIFGLMVCLGYKTRWAFIGAFIMTVSVHNRNWLVNNGGDDILRVILFISIFLPFNKRFSVDSALQLDPPKETGHFSTWGLVFFLQVFCIYFVSYIWKDHSMWREDFSALYYASRLDIFATSLSKQLREFSSFQKASTFFTIWLEFLGPLVLVCSAVFLKHWWRARTLVVFLFWGLHIGIILTMNIGLFPYLCLVMWSIFLPTPFWELLIQKLKVNQFNKLAIYYDGECGFCKKGVLIIKEFFLIPGTTVNVAQEYPEIYSQMQKQNSWVVVNEEGERFFHFQAFIEVLKHSPHMRWLAPVINLRPFKLTGNIVYKWISHNRPIMGLMSQFLVYPASKKEIKLFKWAFNLAGVFFFINLVFWNLTTLKKYNVVAPFWQNVTRWTHLYQEWSMFAPFPKTDNIWIEIPAVLEDGSSIELLTGDRDVYSVKEQRFYDYIPSEHWRKFYLNVSDRSDYADYYGSYLCREWNVLKKRLVPDQTLRKFEIAVYSQLTLPDNKKGSVVRKLTWKHWCFKEDLERDNPNGL